MKNAIDPYVWGTLCWDILFYIMFRVDLSQKHVEVIHLFNMLENMLPCSHCLRHYAIYKRQVPPASNIKKTVADSGSKWLWTVHDMVNQSLGKKSIEYVNLRKRHQSLTCIISDLNVFDFIVYMWMSCKDFESFVKGSITLLNILKSIEHFKVCSIADEYLNQPWSWETVLVIRNSLLTHYGHKSCSLEDMKKLYTNAMST
jgi:hypothetical protein